MFIFKKENYFSSDVGIFMMNWHHCKDEPEHLHEFIEIVYVMDGSGIHGIDGIEYQVKRGSVLFINYRQPHYIKTETGMAICNILLDPEWISEKLIDSENAFELLTLSAFAQFQEEIDTGHALIQFHGAQRRQIENLIQEMHTEYAGREIGYDTVLKAQINILLTYIFRKMSFGSAEKRGKLDEGFLDYIRRHCAEKLTLESLAKECFYNPSYFSRLFREHYGMTVVSFINQSRLEKAMDLLAKTTLSVEEISERAGFSSKTAFYRALKENTGCTPTEYRKKATTKVKK